MKCLRKDVHIVERLPLNMRHFAHIAERRFKQEKNNSWFEGQKICFIINMFRVV